MKLRSGDYKLWIKENVSVAYGKCSKVTEMMVVEFPELKRVRGYYHCPIWGKREHWWLVDTEGEIVDPTVSQFPSGGFGEYEPWIEGSPEPTGMCPNCGEVCYNGDGVCSEKCHQEYMAYLKSI